MVLLEYQRLSSVGYAPSVKNNVRVTRSQGISDSEIAIRLGQGSEVALVERTYGTAEPGWSDSKTLDWIPKGEAAWITFTAGKEKILAAVESLVGS